MNVLSVCICCICGGGRWLWKVQTDWYTLVLACKVTDPVLPLEVWVYASTDRAGWGHTVLFDIVVRIQQLHPNHRQGVWAWAKFVACVWAWVNQPPCPRTAQGCLLSILLQQAVRQTTLHKGTSFLALLYKGKGRCIRSLIIQSRNLHNMLLWWSPGASVCFQTWVGPFFFRNWGCSC